MAFPRDYETNGVWHVRHLKRMGFGMSVFGKFIKLGCEPSTVTMTTLVKGFLSEEKIDEAKQCYENMVEGGFKPDVITYTTLLNGFSKTWSCSVAQQQYGKE